MEQSLPLLSLIRYEIREVLLFQLEIYQLVGWAVCTCMELDRANFPSNRELCLKFNACTVQQCLQCVILRWMVGFKEPNVVINFCCSLHTRPNFTGWKKVLTISRGVDNGSSQWTIRYLDS